MTDTLILGAGGYTGWPLAARPVGAGRDVGLGRITNR